MDVVIMAHVLFYNQGLIIMVHGLISIICISDIECKPLSGSHIGSPYNINCFQENICV